ncbi:uncharacterized protein LOC116247225 [Nymphaea colorata]|uniref:uncharacterized protein LOC116247225 n=1 Tax=Nymphaea colorata TaxID=210225 RepID=UPI00129DE477|nr:uncharacterized protein LOC116247225 [Nymphaea colorata]
MYMGLEWQERAGFSEDNTVVKLVGKKFIPAESASDKGFSLDCHEPDKRMKGGIITASCTPAESVTINSLEPWEKIEPRLVPQSDVQPGVAGSLAAHGQIYLGLEWQEASELEEAEMAGRVLASGRFISAGTMEAKTLWPATAGLQQETHPSHLLGSTEEAKAQPNLSPLYTQISPTFYQVGEALETTDVWSEHAAPEVLELGRVKLQKTKARTLSSQKPPHEHTLFPSSWDQNREAILCGDLKLRDPEIIGVTAKGSLAARAIYGCCLTGITAAGAAAVQVNQLAVWPIHPSAQQQDQPLSTRLNDPTLRQQKVRQCGWPRAELGEVLPGRDKEIAHYPWDPGGREPHLKIPRRLNAKLNRGKRLRRA